MSPQAAEQSRANDGTPGQSRALWLSTVAFTVCFAVWTIFSIIGVQIQKDLGPSLDTEQPLRVRGLERAIGEYVRELPGT